MSRIILKINGKLLAIRSLWLSNGFASFGKTSRIAKGVTLCGGDCLKTHSGQNVS